MLVVTLLVLTSRNESGRYVALLHRLTLGGLARRKPPFLVSLDVPHTPSKLESPLH
jgi:hypothetical protein